jgi:2'-5' RNA ligase
MRAFIAVDLSEEIRAKIKEIQKHFIDLGSEQKGALKFVNPSQMHQTVKFLGEVPEEEVEGIKRALSEIAQKPFDIELRGVGFFPEGNLEKVRTIRVIWIGIERGLAALKALHEDVESRLHALGFPLEKRFNPHITLCRVKKPLSKTERGRIVKRIEELQDVGAGEMRVEELKLKKSTLTPKGPIYDDIYVKGLQ